MKKTRRIISLIVAVIFAVTLAVVPTSADEVDSLRDQINKLEQQIKDKANEIKDIQSDKKDQQKLKNKYEEQMALYMAQIDICNAAIRDTNEKIAKNEADIVAKETQMAEAITEFKKRISSIYMSSSSDSGIEILLGAENFSDFLALSQLSLNISKRDQLLMDDITAMIKEINASKKANEDLLESQKEIKELLNEKYEEYDALVREAKQNIAELNQKESGVASDKKRLENDLKAKEAYLNELLNPSDDDVYKGYFDGTFTWPVPGYLGMTSGYGERWGTMHKGIDIASAGIKGKAIIAAASGVVAKTYTSCPHNYGKNGSCYQGGVRCGGGYGNHVVISHGKAGSTYYQSLYGHMSSVAVKPGQYVKQGDVIGYVGSTGYSTGWHLHFEIHKSSDGKTFKHTDPEPYVKKKK